MVKSFKGKSLYLESDSNWDKYFDEIGYSKNDLLIVEPKTTVAVKSTRKRCCLLISSATLIVTLATVVIILLRMDFTK